MSLFDKIDNKNIPQHVAIIMDGNGRWAKSKGLDRTEGHREGVKSLRKTVEAAAKANVKYLTVYAFSTENWNRPNEEVDALMGLMVYAVALETENLVRNGIRVECIGDIKRLPQQTQEAIQNCKYRTSRGKRMTLVLALSYSSRWEITETLKAIAADIKDGVLLEKDVTETTIDNYLTTKNMPDLDLLIRTGGDVRISNFMLWQAAYSELYFTEIFWPDFDEEGFYEAILNYQKKERRYGKISEQL